MEIEFKGKLWYWKGPAPFYFVTVPAKQTADLRTVAEFVTYGWGMIPVSARIGESEWKTALFPKDGRYIVPIRANVRLKERLDEGKVVRIRLQVRGSQPMTPTEQSPQRA